MARAYINKDDETLTEGVEFKNFNDFEKIITFIRGFGCEAEFSFDSKYINKNSDSLFPNPADTRIFLSIYDKNVGTSMENILQDSMMRPPKKILLLKGSVLIFDYSIGNFSVAKKEDLDTKLYEF